MNTRSTLASLGCRGGGIGAEARMNLIFREISCKRAFASQRKLRDPPLVISPNHPFVFYPTSCSLLDSTPTSSSTTHFFFFFSRSCDSLLLNLPFDSQSFSGIDHNFCFVRKKNIVLISYVKQNIFKIFQKYSPNLN